MPHKSRFALVCVLLSTACNSQLDYGSRPHLLGKLDGVDVHQSRRELAAAMPELDGKHDVEDGRLRYRVWFDYRDPDRIDSLMEFVDGTVDGPQDAWGSGAAGRDYFRDYYDDEHRTRFTLRLPPDELTAKRFILVAEPFRRLSTILDKASDVKLFGMDILDAPMSAVADGLAKEGLPIAAAGATAVAREGVAFQRPRDHGGRSVPDRRRRPLRRRHRQQLHARLHDERRV